jgi:hypothetical protein
MKTKKLLFYLLAGILGGCIPVMSLHPLYTEKDLAYDEKLLGTWVDDSDETTWQFIDANKPEKAYNLIFTDEKGQKGSFIAHLVKLDSKLFLDVYPSEPPWGKKGENEDDPNKVKWPYNALFCIPAHTFIKIDSIDPNLTIRLTDDGEMNKLFEQDPNAVEHTLIEDKKPVLTASTEKLQAFVLKYADDSRVFTKEDVLTRKKIKAPQDTVKQKSNESNNPNKN